MFLHLCHLSSPTCILIIHIFFWYCSTTLPHSVLFFFYHSFFSICISVWEVSFDLSSNSLIFFLTHVESTDEPIKAILHLCRVMLIYNASFWLFFIVSVSVYILHIFMYTVSFFHRTLKKLSTVIFNWLAANSKICVISLFCFLGLFYFFRLLVLFFLFFTCFIHFL